MSNPTPPPPTTDPSASAREWAARDAPGRESAATALRSEEEKWRRNGLRAANDLDLARRVLADAPALLARLEEAERLLREARTAYAGLWFPEDSDKIDAFFAPPNPRAEGPSRG